MKKTENLSWYKFIYQFGWPGFFKPGWLFQVLYSWDDASLKTVLLAFVFAIGWDDDIPFSIFPKVYALKRSETDKPLSKPELVETQLFFAWCGFVFGTRSTVLPRKV
jgi:hypothetical protein